MQTYDQIEGFEYWNIDAWKKFIEGSVAPLFTSTSKLLKLREYILSIVGIDGKTTLSEIESRKRELIPFFLGGVKEDGEYKDNSLAKLVKLTLGIYVNPKEWVILEREGELRAFDYVTIKIESTPFLEFLKKLHEISLHITKLVGIELREASESEIEEIIQKPEKLLEIIKTTYIKCLEVSANYSYYTFFALSTKNLPFKYLITAYPKLQTNFKLLSEFLGLEKIFEPKINETKTREDYTIWGHTKNGLCKSLYDLNRVIWDNFMNMGIKDVFNYVSTDLRDLKQEFKEKVKLIVGEWPPAEMEIFHRWEVGYDLIVEGPRITRCFNGYSPTYYKHVDESVNISLIDFLMKVSPGLFLGLASIKKMSENILEYDGFALDRLEFALSR